MSEYRDEPEPRHDLPKRRLTETHKVTTPGGNTVYLSVGYDPHEDGRPREVFYSGGFKSGSQLEFQIQDTCVLISLLLQHVHRADDIAKSLAQLERPTGDTVYGSLTGLIVATLIEADLR